MPELPEVEALAHHLREHALYRPVARVDNLVHGARYEAMLRMRLDVNQLPKPFQLNALTSREWQLDSEPYRWSFTP